MIRQIAGLTFLVILLITIGNSNSYAKRINMSKMMDAMKKFSGGTNYGQFSNLMRSYKIMFGKVKGLLRHKLKVLADRWAASNMNKNSKTSLGNEIKNTMSSVTNKWNNNCKDKFGEMVETYGENPGKSDFTAAEAELEGVAGSYIYYVVQKIDYLRSKIEQQDGGLFLDDLSSNVSPALKLMTMWKDGNRVYAQFRSSLEKKMHELHPFSTDRTPNKAESFLLKRMTNLEKKEWNNLKKQGKQLLKIKNRKKALPLHVFRKGILKLKKKEQDLLEDTTKAMAKMVNAENGLSGSANQLKSKLLTLSKVYFKKVKDEKAMLFQNVLDQAENEVDGKSNSGNLVYTIGQKRHEVLAGVEDAIANLVQQVAKEASKSSGSEQDKISEGLPLMKDEIDSKMAVALTTLQNFADQETQGFNDDWQQNQSNQQSYGISKIESGGLKPNLQKRATMFYMKRVHDTGLKDIMEKVKQKSNGKFGYKNIQNLVKNKERAVLKVVMKNIKQKVDELTDELGGQSIYTAIKEAMPEIRNMITSDVNSAYATIKAYADDKVHDWQKGTGMFKTKNAVYKAWKKKNKKKG